MERKTLSEQSKQEIVEKPVQKRSPEEKIGRIKWNQILLNRVLDEIKKFREDMEAEKRQIREEIKQLRVMERAILNGFRGSGIIKYTVPMIERIACVDAVDFAILESVYRAASPGVLPKIVAVDIDVDAELRKRSPYDLKYYDVSRRIVHMNKRLFEELAECLFEKRGLKWALTSFAFEVWGEEKLGETEKENTTSTLGSS